MIDIGIVTLKENEYLDRCLASIAKHIPTEIAKPVVVIRDGSEASNFNYLLTQAQSDYMIYINDDIEILNGEWIYEMYALMKRPEVGLATCREINDTFDLQMYRMNPDKFLLPAEEVVLSLSWAASYVFGFNRSRVPFLKFDENIPCGYPDPDCGVGMFDLDASLQVRSNGFQILKRMDSFVHHTSYTKPTVEMKTMKRKKFYEEQKNYMISMWGDFYLQACGVSKDTQNIK